jgi:hypothetical protein
MAEVKRFISQRFHRNGVSGDPAIVTAFVSSEGDNLVAVSLTPPLNSDLTPFDFYGGEDATEERFIDRWLDVFAVRSVVVDPTDPTRTLRGADMWGREIAQEWRRLCQTGNAHGEGMGGYDPALEWYHEVHADPDVVAALMAENAKSIEEFLS